MSEETSKLKTKLRYETLWARMSSLNMAKHTIFVIKTILNNYCRLWGAVCLLCGYRETQVYCASLIARNSFFNVYKFPIIDCFIYIRFCLDTCMKQQKMDGWIATGNFGMKSIRWVMIFILTKRLNQMNETKTKEQRESDTHHICLLCWAVLRKWINFYILSAFFFCRHRSRRRRRCLRLRIEKFKWITFEN